MSINFGLCRLCMDSKCSLSTIFNESQMATEIFLVTGVKIIELENHKALICDACRNYLFIAIKLRKDTQNSDKYFKKSIALIEKNTYEKEFEHTRSIKFEEEEEIKCEPVLADLIGEYNNDSQSSTTSYAKEVNQTIKEIYKCDLCEIEYSFKQLLTKHMKNSHLKKPKVVKCNDIILKSKLRQHGNYESSRKRHKKQCHRKTMLKKEEILHASQQQRYICPTCAKIFKSKSNMSQHEKTHKKLKPSEYFYCDQCGNKFKEKTLMISHIRNRHIKKIRFNCQLCDKTYATKFHLSTHMKVNHYNIRDFKCEYCNKEFGEKKKLVAHVRIHTGEQPFQCKFCDRKFTHQTDYRRHQWNHTGHKRFICKNCNQGFMKNAELQSHLNRCRVQF